MNEREQQKKAMMQMHARAQSKAQTDPKIAQALQLSQALRDAYASCNGDTSLYRFKRAQIYAQHGSATVDWQQKYNVAVPALQAEISQLKTELLLADTDRGIYKSQLESNGIKPLI